MLGLSLHTRRLLVAIAAISLLAGYGPSGRTAATTGDPVLLNEALLSHTGTDTTEFVELYGTPGASLAGLSLIAVEGDSTAGPGTIDRRIDFAAGATIGGNRFYLVGNPAGLVPTYGVTPNVEILSDFFENSSLTLAIVTTSSISGTSVTGSEVVRDAIALTDGGPTDVFYFGAPVFGPDGAFFPAGVRRASDGVDTDTVGDWALADFNLGTANTPTAGTALGNQAVIAACGAPLTVLEGASATRQVTASDLDGTVTSIAIQSITPTDPATISVGATTPASGVGGTASATVTVGAATPAGSYSVLMRATNNDADPQSGDCTLSVTVTPVLSVGQLQGQTTDAENGLTDASPWANQIVWVRGVVTQRLRFPNNSGGQEYGFFLQSTIAGADGDPLTSDGLFVFHRTFATLLRAGGGTYFPVVGDQIVLNGIVQESFNLTRLGTTTTSPLLVAVEATGVDIATQVVTTEAAPPDDLAAANRFWERHEGMRFHVDANAHVVAARDGFLATKDAELWVIRGDHPLNDPSLRPDPYTRIVYRDPHPLDDIGPAGSFDNGNGMRIMLQSHGLKWLASSNETLIAPANTYDTVTNALTGGLYYAFGKYGIEVEQQLALASGVDPAGNAPPSAAVDGVEFATSDYNVENLYDRRDDPFDLCDFTDPLTNPGCTGVSPPFDYVPASDAIYQGHLTDLARQIVGPMHAPDLLMIQEAEDQDICVVSAETLVCGATDDADGKPDTLQELALAISDAGGPTYDVAYDRDGADDRGIVSAFMFRTDTVELLPADASDPVLGSSPTVDYRGEALGYNSDVSNPKALNADLPGDVPLDTGVDGGNVYTRPPQVGHFRIWRDGIGLSVFTDLYALSNHFSSTPNARVGQRIEQARYNVAIVDALEAAGTDRVISAGDFNVFPRPDDPFAPLELWGCNPSPCSEGKSDQLGPMYTAGLRNLWDTLVEEVPQSAYSYNFVGQVQTLDMQWATDGQFADLVEVRAGHFNVDFAADHDGDVARGASDHDPQLARWFTDVTFDRLHALVDYYVATGDLPADKEFLFENRLFKAVEYLAEGKVAAAQAQLHAFGNQAYDYAPPDVAQALEKEGDRLASQL